jgi:hypothetical protein
MIYFKIRIHRDVGERGIVTHPSDDSRFKSCLRTFKALPLLCRGLFIAGIFLCSFTGLDSVAHSGTYSLSPSGSDANPGTSASPWKTFSFAIPKLQPGDTLILQDGTYNSSNSGFPDIDGKKNAKNGTALNPITFKAQNERKAFIEGNGMQDPLRIANLSFWIFEGIYAKSAENHNQTASVGHAISVSYSNNLVFKRILATHNNRWVNTHLLALMFCEAITVEESEFYYFHRHGILNWHTNNSIYRRNYFNSRGYGQVTGGWHSVGPTKGDFGIANYPGSYNIHENNVSENNVVGISIQATKASVGNRILGNISLNETYGFQMQARGDGSKMPMDTIIENHVSITPEHSGLWARTAKNTQIKNSSFFGGRSGVIADFIEQVPGDGIYSTFVSNVLAMDNSGVGFTMLGQTTWSIGYPNNYNNNLNFSPSTHVTNATNLNPGFGACRVFVPKNSPLKGIGAGGADIGANVLYRYEKGVLTDHPLWNKTTGEFPHGALVPGVNDIAGDSAFDVHKRLNVNANGCTLPGTSIDTIPPAVPKWKNPPIS